MPLVLQEPFTVKFLHNLGLYIHIPFCKRKCAYCDFYSIINNDELKVKYLNALMGDIKNWGGQIDRPFDSIYIGGGTPSLLGKEIVPLINCVRKNFNICDNAEITAEVNPDVSDDFLKYAYSVGVNRISIGIQSGNDEELKVLGRTHTAKDAEYAIERIKKAGFSNISADLMIALPNSNLDSLKNNLDFFLGLDVPHISSYILKIEEKTKFSKFSPQVPNDDECFGQYLYMCEYLENAGYKHYEISNFAKDGLYSRHNLKYWNLDEYLGIGPCAHSFLDGKRFYYDADIKKYIKNPKTVFEDFGGDEQERIMLGLRTSDGIDLTKYKCEKLEFLLSNLERENLIYNNEYKISLTNKGFLVSNTIINLITECVL